MIIDRGHYKIIYDKDIIECKTDDGNCDWCFIKDDRFIKADHNISGPWHRCAKCAEELWNDLGNVSDGFGEN
tara:strand:- start:71 stop:286 length:216 start_codon:yes stop_codon:yes gene_type:complete